MMELAGAHLDDGGDFDPQRDEQKLSEIVDWAVQEQGAAGPREFLQLLKNVDQQTRMTPGFLHERVFRFAQMDRIRRAQRELQRG